MQKNVLEYLEKTAQQFPDKIAVEDESGTVTFSELRTNALAISTHLIESGLNGCEPVAVYMKKSIKAIEALLGILYAGGFYVPLDVSNPDDRVAAILGKVAPRFVLSQALYRDNLKCIAEAPKIIDLDATLGAETLKFRYIKNIDSDPAYIINTSGSTGIPKAVVISHRAIIDYIDWASETYSIDENHVIGNQAPFFFDNSVLDIYLMLKTGAKLLLIPEKLFLFPVRLIEYLNFKLVTFIFWVPTAMANIAKLKALNGIELKHLSHILFAGEVMPAKVYMYWKKHLPKSLFSNLYGPTEITVDCTYIILTEDYKASEPLPIGYPCRNSDILVLDDNDGVVLSPGIDGELCVRGTSLALGYYNDPEKTEKAFVQNPLNSHYPERIYRTGDIVYYNERGELMYKGRKDFQIKHMGYRIELGEIEAAALALNGVDKACAIYDYNKKNVVLAYEAEANIKRKDILLGLRERLPKYMLPARFENIKVMPTNVNGKIDRAKLKDDILNVRN